MQAGTERYVQYGIAPGSFLCAVLSNNLTQAYLRADDVNTSYMRQWALWLRRECPRDAWGDPDKVTEWIEIGGQEGINTLAEQEDDFNQAYREGRT
jgi:hypothetical protein